MKKYEKPKVKTKNKTTYHVSEMEFYKMNNSHLVNASERQKM